LPTNILVALTESLTSNPPPSDEKWYLGPRGDIVTKIPHYETVEGRTDGLQVVHYEYHTLICTKQAAQMYIRRKGVTAEIAFAEWRQRLNGIIEDEDINVAVLALDDARTKSLTSYHNSASQDDDMPLAERFGHKFETRVRHFSPHLIVMDLLWIDGNDPELKRARGRSAAGR
jgi:hypothetical protein